MAKIILTTDEQLSELLEKTFLKFHQKDNLQNKSHQNDKSGDSNEAYTTQDLVKKLRKTPNTIASYERKGWLTPTKLGSSRNSRKTYPREQVDALIAANTFNRKK